MEKEKRVCLRSRDIELILFLAEYGIITNENVKLLYQSEYYYKNRLASLAKGDMIERLYGKVILSRKGKRYLNEVGLGYRNINRDETYKKRMERISDIACKVKSCGWYFEPSWKCDVNTYTKRGNRYVGIMSREEKRWNEEFMRNKVKEIFGNDLISLKTKSFFDDYYINENDVYTYIFYMPFANFYLMDYINFQATSNLMEGTKAKVVCLDNCVEFVRKYLDEAVEVTCISVD